MKKKIKLSEVISKIEKENKLNIPLPNADEAKANSIMYMVQDMLDGISHGISIDLKEFEKKVLDIIKSKDF